MPSDFDDLIRRADPAKTKRGDPMPPRGIALLSKYRRLEDQGSWLDRVGRRGRSRRLALGTVIALAAATAVVLGGISMQAVPAIAATPEPLTTRPVSADATELLKKMNEMVQPRTVTAGAIRTLSWSLDTSINDSGEIESSSIEPRRSETVFHPDGKVTFRLEAAAPFPGQDRRDLLAPGTVIAEENYGVGEYPFANGGELPQYAKDIAQFFAESTGEDVPTAGSSIREMAGLLSSSLLSSAQESAFLEYFASLPAVTVRGEVTDRLGRRGIAFAASDRVPGEFEDLLIVDEMSGNILATETVYIGSERTDIASPAVIDYAAWDRSEL